MRRMLGIASLALLVLSSACTQDQEPDAAQDVTPKQGPTITVGSADFPESVTLAEIYAQGLEADGYTTDTKLRIGSREVYFPALEGGEIDLMPEYTGSLLSYLTKQEAVVPADPQEAYDDLATELEDSELTLLDHAQAQDKDGIVVNRETADEYDLEAVSDLEPVASELVMGGPPECPQRQACLKGLQEVYGIEFKEFKPLDVAGPQTIEALKANEIQVANLFTTQSAIAANDFVLLEDDEGIVGAESVVPVIRTETLDAYDDELVERINAISETLTTEGLLELNDRVENDKEDPEDVAADFLAEEGLA